MANVWITDMIKKFIIFIFLLLLPTVIFGQEYSEENQLNQDVVFKAKVIEIIEQKNIVREDGSVSIQQKIRLKGINGDWKDKEVIFDGTEFDVLSGGEYSLGDKVLVNRIIDTNGKEDFYIIGFSRAGYIYWIALLLALVVIIIGKFKGVRALAVLLLTFVIILKFIIPKILSGGDPLLISIIGSFFIIILSVYITEGLKRTSTISIISILISLTATGFLSVWFSAITKLTGFASEDVMYLVGSMGGNINLKGLLLAGIIIGTLGILDDVVISQVVLVKELKLANPEFSKYKIYRQAMRVGVSHLSSMINTLFLAYAGASLPLLILFSVGEPPFLTFSQVIDNEMIATEIVRTIVGSIGLVIAVPISTFLAVNFLTKKVKSKE